MRTKHWDYMTCVQLLRTKHWGYVTCVQPMRTKQWGHVTLVQPINSSQSRKVERTSWRPTTVCSSTAVYHSVGWSYRRCLYLSHDLCSYVSASLRLCRVMSAPWHSRHPSVSSCHHTELTTPRLTLTTHCSVLCQTSEWFPHWHSNAQRCPVQHHSTGKTSSPSQTPHQRPSLGHQNPPFVYRRKAVYQTYRRPTWAERWALQGNQIWGTTECFERIFPHRRMLWIPERESK